MEREDIYTRVTNQIVAVIEAGQTSYQMPWHRSATEFFRPTNISSKRLYRGINLLSLWSAALARGYESGFWGTYQQWKQVGAQVRRGEKSCEVVLWKPVEAKKQLSEQPEVNESRRNGIIALGYPVFNAAQVDGFIYACPRPLSEDERIKAAEDFFAELPADIRHGGNEAFFDVLGDYIQMPEFGRFRGAHFYYSTLAHESVHWTGAKPRLDRQLENRFGSEAYAVEELIAELGAAFLAAQLQLCSEPRGNHAAYIASWLRVLKSDKKAIFTAASKAQQAVDWLIARTRLQEVPESE
jgi:antirestriction protein ArdC